MSTVFNFLTNLKLTISQWAMACMAAIIAGLVIALDLQGSKLHKAQVDILRATFGAAMTKQDTIVDNAREAYLNALAEYEGHQ
jgi:hypothetical protein